MQGNNNSFQSEHSYFLYRTFTLGCWLRPACLLLHELCALALVRIYLFLPCRIMVRFVLEGGADFFPALMKHLPSWKVRKVMKNTYCAKRPGSWALDIWRTPCQNIHVLVHFHGWAWVWAFRLVETLCISGDSAYPRYFSRGGSFTPVLVFQGLKISPPSSVFRICAADPLTWWWGVKLTLDIVYPYM